MIQGVLREGDEGFDALKELIAPAVPIEYGLEHLKPQYEMWLTFELNGERMTATAQTEHFPSMRQVDDMMMKIRAAAKIAPDVHPKQRQRFYERVGRL